MYNIFSVCEQDGSFLKDILVLTLLIQIVRLPFASLQELARSQNKVELEKGHS